MKRVFILITVSFLFAIGGFNLKAVESLYPKNILNLNNIMIYDEVEESNAKYALKTIKPIKLKEGKTYTFVMSKDYFDDRHWGHPNFIYEVFYKFLSLEEEKVVGSSSSYSFKNDYTYFTFEAVYSLLEIHEIPFDIKPNTLNQDIMIYEGEIDLFNGEFTSYKSNYTPLKRVYIKDYDVDLTTEEIISSVSIYEDNTKDFTVIKDEYETSNGKPGEFSILLMANSESNNRSFMEIVVKVADITPPVFKGENHYEFELKENMPTIEEIIYNIDVVDNYSSLNRNDIVIVTDTYSYNKNYKGNYLIVLKAIDDFGNSSTFEITITVYDDTPPVIKGPLEIYRYTTDNPLTDEDIRDLFTVTDNVDENLIDELIIEGEYNNVPGVYVYNLSVSDTSGNRATHQLTVNVLGGSSPTFNEDDSYILTYKEYKNMTQEDIKEWLNKNLKTSSDIKILIDENIYLKDKNKGGYIYYSYLDEGKTHYGRILVKESKESITTTIALILSIVIINLSFIIMYVKRPKMHL